MKTYDAIIIGSGQSGTPLAFRLAAEGQTVALIEKDQLGGTCVNVGCTPTKAYVASARRMWDAQHGRDLGVEIPPGSKVNLAKVRTRKNKLIASSRKGIAESIDKEDDITLYRATARFTGPRTVSTGDESLTAERIFINVGARPSVPEALAKVPYLTNASILELTELPEHLLIVGGSYIGLEFGQMFARFGSKVTVIEREDRIIRREDKAVSSTIQAFMENDGVAFRLGANCIDASNRGDGQITLKLDCGDADPDNITGSHLLLAVGRHPNTDTLQLNATHVATDERGYIAVDDHCQTNMAGIFATGDCNGQGAFTHTSYHDFQIVADFLFGDQSTRISDRITTYALFVDPPLGRIGMTQQQAQAKGHTIKVAHLPMSEVARAREKGETQGFMHAIIDAKTDRILGAAVLGTGGDEVISSFTSIMYADQPFTRLRDTVQIHPTVSELIPTMLEHLQKPAT